MKPVASRRRFLLTGLSYLATFLALGLKSDSAARASTRAGRKTAEKHYLLNAEQEQGPFYIDHSRVRRDITEGKHGVPLTLKIRVVDPLLNGAPVAGCAVDIWHCDPSGEYSGYAQMPFPPLGDGPKRPAFPMGGPPHLKPSNEKRFLRGIQISDENGCVEFQTIYPGWYVGRAVHIHMKVHAPAAAGKPEVADHIVHTGQLFFPEKLSDEIMKQGSYFEHKGQRTLQSQDHIFLDEHGQQAMVTTSRKGALLSDGLVATATLGVDPKATPARVGIF